MSLIHSKQLNPKFTGSFTISGSLRIEGQTVFDSLDTNLDSLVVSGSMSVVNQKVDNAIASSSIFIQDLGTIASREKAGVMDCGDGFS